MIMIINTVDKKYMRGACQTLCVRAHKKTVYSMLKGFGFSIGVRYNINDGCKSRLKRRIYIKYRV